jgi:nucleoside-diphosphate-sugar epimerase
VSATSPHPPGSKKEQLMSNQHQPPVLLTGASGVVGGAVLRRLTDRDVICLTHRHGVNLPNVRCVRGDLTADNFGLDDDTYAGLTESVGAVVHCAAIVNFATVKDETEDLNVRGVRKVVAFAAQAGATLHHVSTAFVRKHDITSDAASAARPEIYIDSKRRGERVVLQSGVPANIVRPSVVIGDADTGMMPQFQGLHILAAASLRRELPFLPLLPGTPVDFVPRDLVADVIVDLVRTGVVGEQRWVTAGDQALPVERIFEIILAVGAERGLELELPRFVDPTIVPRLIRPVFLDSLPDEQMRRFDEMTATTGLFVTPELLPSRYGSRMSAPTQAELEEALRMSLRYLAEVKRIGVRQEVAA